MIHLLNTVVKTVCVLCSYYSMKSLLLSFAKKSIFSSEKSEKSVSRYIRVLFFQLLVCYYFENYKKSSITL